MSLIGIFLNDLIEFVIVIFEQAAVRRSRVQQNMNQQPLQASTLIWYRILKNKNRLEFLHLNLKLSSVQLSGYSCHTSSSPELSESDIDYQTQSRTRQAACSGWGSNLIIIIIIIKLYGRMHSVTTLFKHAPLKRSRERGGSKKRFELRNRSNGNYSIRKRIQNRNKPTQEEILTTFSSRERTK